MPERPAVSRPAHSRARATPDRADVAAVCGRASPPRSARTRIAANLGRLLRRRGPLAAGARRPARVVRRCRGAAQAGLRHRSRTGSAPARCCSAGLVGFVAGVGDCTPSRTGRAGCGPPGSAKAPRPRPSRRRPPRWSPGSTRRPGTVARSAATASTSRIGYTLGPLLGGVLVWVGGLRLLFAVMAVCGAVVVAVWAAIAVPAVPPLPADPADRGRSGPSAERSGPFVAPTAALAGATAALSVGVGFLPVTGAAAGLGSRRHRGGRVRPGRDRRAGPAQGRSRPGRTVGSRIGGGLARGAAARRGRTRVRRRSGGLGGVLLAAA